MAGMIRKSLNEPEETRPFEEGKGKLDLVHLEAGGVGRAVFEPGWQWSKHVKPIVQTDSCEAAHAGYVLSGRIKVVMDDGQEEEFGAGDYMSGPAGPRRVDRRRRAVRGPGLAGVRRLRQAAGLSGSAPAPGTRGADSAAPSTSRLQVSAMAGRVVHFEIPAEDTDRAKDFYASAFGWNIEPEPEIDYNMVMTAPTDKSGMPSEPGSINGGLFKREGN